MHQKVFLSSTSTLVLALSVRSCTARALGSLEIILTARLLLAAWHASHRRTSPLRLTHRAAGFPTIPVTPFFSGHVGKCVAPDIVLVVLSDISICLPGELVGLYRLELQRIKWRAVVVLRNRRLWQQSSHISLLHFALCACQIVQKRCSFNGRRQVAGVERFMLVSRSCLLMWHGYYCSTKSGTHTKQYWYNRMEKGPPDSAPDHRLRAPIFDFFPALIKFHLRRREFSKAPTGFLRANETQ